jgi:MFS transporter, PAT family, solute carrier family 33 (acetyl-CoA transportor), member 1
MAITTEQEAMLDLRYSTDMANRRASNDHLSDSPDPLDEEPFPKPRLSSREKKNLLFLGALYFIHAIPLQFSWLTMPILLRQQLSYSDVGTFLVSQYPFSWKVAWSPVVDGFHIPMLGRRKTWMVPSLVAAGGVLFWLSFSQDSLVAQIAAGSSAAMVWTILAWFLIMVFCANVRIAIDSWAIDLLSPPNVHWASPAVTIGEALSGLVSFNVFLGTASLSSSQDASGKMEPADTHFFFLGSAAVFVLTAIMLMVGRRENNKEQRTRTVRQAYTIIWNILKLRHVWILMLIHMVSMVGFITNDTITVLQLVKNHFDDFELAALGTVTLPFAIAGGFLVARAFQTRHPLHVWRQMFPWRLLTAFVSQLTILFISRYPHSSFRWLVVFMPFCLSRFFESAMWVSFVAFHAQLADPQCGGIYMSLLSTTLNIRYDTLQFFFTKTIGMIDGTDDLTKPSPLIDGYQMVNLASIVLAILLYRFFLRPATMHLQTIDVTEWRVKDTVVASPAAYEMVRTRDRAEHIDED